MTDLDLEFEHIYLEAKAERWHQIERFLFSYFCYREGYLSSKGNPDWEKARASSPRSLQVESLSQSDLEPVVPLEVVVGEIKRYVRDGELTPTTLKRVLDCLLHYKTISKAQKQALKKAGLQSAMPASWYQSEEKDPYLRFKLQGIIVQETPE